MMIVRSIGYHWEHAPSLTMLSSGKSRTPFDIMRPGESENASIPDPLALDRRANSCAKRIFAVLLAAYAIVGAKQAGLE